LKPSNIVVRKDDSPVIVDFGIAKVNASNMQVAATQTGEVFGSPAYMSPEQINGTVVDARADQYALGCILFECLTGAPPFVGDSAVEIMLAHRDREPASLQEASLGKTFPQGLELMVQRMLAKEPQQRFPDMSAVKQSLSAALDPTVGPNGSGRSSGSKSKGDSADKAMTRSTAASKNKLAPLVGLLIVLLLGIGTIFYSVNQDAGRKPQPEQTKTAVSPQSASNAVMPASIKESLDVTNMNLWVGRMRGFEGKRVLDTLAVDGLDEHGLDAPSIKRALTDEAILSIPKQPNAKKIDFSSCPHVTGTGLTRQGGDNIKTLNLDNCGITDDGLKSLNKFPNLQNLYLDATKITDKGMESLALFVPHLKVLTISSDSKLTGDCLNAVAKLHNLTQLEARSTNIAAGFKHFQQTKLEDLQIGGSNISDEDLQVLSAIKTLKVIGVSGCDITDHGLDHLSRLKLTSIDLTNCRRVTKGGIRSFEAQEAHCRITQ
jgi:hypothetical protein